MTHTPATCRDPAHCIDVQCYGERAAAFRAYATHRKTVVDVKEVDLTTTAPATLKRRFYGLLFDKRFWDELAAENPRISVTLRGVVRGSRYVVQLVVTETLKPLPHEL